MDRPTIRLAAHPGAKYAKEEFGEVVVNAVAGNGQRAFIGLDGSTVEMPNFPIASFYGPCAKADAQLFVAANALVGGVDCLEEILVSLCAYIAKRTDGEADFAQDPEVIHALCFARMVRIFACGIEVVKVTGATAISAENPAGEPIDEWLPIRQAIGLAAFGQGSVRYSKVAVSGADLVAAGDKDDAPAVGGNTVGEAMTPKDPDPLGEEPAPVPDPAPDDGDNRPQAKGVTS